MDGGMFRSSFYFIFVGFNEYHTLGNFVVTSRSIVHERENNS